MTTGRTADFLMYQLIQEYLGQRGLCRVLEDCFPVEELDHFADQCGLLQPAGQSHRQKAMALASFISSSPRLINDVAFVLDHDHEELIGAFASAESSELHKKYSPQSLEEDIPPGKLLWALFRNHDREECKRLLQIWVNFLEPLTPEQQDVPASPPDEPHQMDEEGVIEAEKNAVASLESEDTDYMEPVPMKESAPEEDIREPEPQSLNQMAARLTEKFSASEEKIRIRLEQAERNVQTLREQLDELRQTGSPKEAAEAPESDREALNQNEPRFSALEDKVDALEQRLSGELMKEFAALRDLLEGTFSKVDRLEKRLRALESEGAEEKAEPEAMGTLGGKMDQIAAMLLKVQDRTQSIEERLQRKEAPSEPVEEEQPPEFEKPVTETEEVAPEQWEAAGLDEEIEEEAPAETERSEVLEEQPPEEEDVLQAGEKLPEAETEIAEEERPEEKVEEVLPAEEDLPGAEIEKPEEEPLEKPEYSIEDEESFEEAFEQEGTEPILTEDLIGKEESEEGLLEEEQAEAEEVAAEEEVETGGWYQEPVPKGETEEEAGPEEIQEEIERAEAPREEVLPSTEETAEEEPAAEEELEEEVLAEPVSEEAEEVEAEQEPEKEEIPEEVSEAPAGEEIPAEAPEEELEEEFPLEEPAAEETEPVSRPPGEEETDAGKQGEEVSAEPRDLVPVGPVDELHRGEEEETGPEESAEEETGAGPVFHREKVVLVGGPDNMQGEYQKTLEQLGASFERYSTLDEFSSQAIEKIVEDAYLIIALGNVMTRPGTFQLMKVANQLGSRMYVYHSTAPASLRRFILKLVEQAEI